MAGGAFKSFGLVLVILGVLGVLVGGGLALTGFLQERGNQGQHGPFAQPDRDATATNVALAAAGGLAALAGLALLVSGAVFQGVGSARQDRALVEAILVKGLPPQA